MLNERSRLIRTVALAGLLIALVAGCGGDPVQKMVNDPATRARLVDLMVQDPVIAETLATRLLGSGESRTMLLNHALADGASSQEMMLRVSKDPAFMSGAIGLGMQDPVMKDQLLTLLKGIQMAQ